jgi:cbb3-type cytochrome oxidase subunit 3
MRTLLLLILLVVIVTVYRPQRVWREVMRVWGHRDYALRVIVVVVGIYFLYGLYSMYERGMLSWDWYQ